MRQRSAIRRFWKHLVALRPAYLGILPRNGGGDGGGGGGGLTRDEGGDGGTLTDAECVEVDRKVVEFLRTQAAAIAALRNGDDDAAAAAKTGTGEAEGTTTTGGSWNVHLLAVMLALTEQLSALEQYHVKLRQARAEDTLARRQFLAAAAPSQASSPTRATAAAAAASGYAHPPRPTRPSHAPRAPPTPHAPIPRPMRPFQALCAYPTPIPRPIRPSGRPQRSPTTLSLCTSTVAVRDTDFTDDELQVFALEHPDYVRELNARVTEMRSVIPPSPFPRPRTRTLKVACPLSTQRHRAQDPGDCAARGRHRDAH